MTVRTVICGAGISGLALAHRLAAHGGEVVVIERAPGPHPQGYMIDFFGPGLEAVEAMGLLPAFERAAYPYDEGHLVDRNGRRRATLQTKSFSRGPLLSLMRPDIEAVLRENLPAEVELRYDTVLTEVANRTDGVAVTLEDGTVFDADLLVGADGIHSTVRRLVFGPEDRYLRYLGLHTAAFTFDAPDVHAATKRAFCLTDSVNRQLGFYALRDGRVATFAVHRSADPTIPDDPRVAIQRAYTGLGWVTPRALEQCPPAEEIYYDQVAQIELPGWSTGRVVLLGDAAYAVSLLAGQGASLGISGAFLLADRLAHAPTVERATAGFERLWRPVVEEKQRNARSMARWFLPSSPTDLRVRRVMLGLTRVPFVMGYVNSILAGKNTRLADVMRQASGAATEPAVP
ncbi:FAD-dependent monooxygenase [Streptosporangium sp. NBC_01755]|uniref:FAD-dependent monooxygenase n=1 Tax=unclassified Streptosporangium TaxID=2632669 RepID=UPI002DD86F99|nr:MULTISPECIES: FAD-dependent monooxygenase [unclassified Streptosporangium]WSA28652.1 FAD-dependent monooxygenase [Streptosporangium sp. NBC_01810]WSC99896.1 FAD-dependent monooxygenase [Streptosporangium sp. NBC_01755]